MTSEFASGTTEVTVRLLRCRSLMRDTASQRAVARTALLRFLFFQLSTSPGRQHESLPAEVTGQRQGLKYHRSGERADDRLAEVMRGRARFETIPSL